jgi:hypothetical protein
LQKNGAITNTSFVQGKNKTKRDKNNPCALDIASQTLHGLILSCIGPPFGPTAIHLPTNQSF